VSLAELLTAARSLPRAEQLELARTLNGDTPPPDLSEIPEHLQHLIPPPGVVMSYWKPELTPEGWEQVRLALDEIEATRGKS
jgi:hypothetical protein